ncbi:alpha/beta hydrolase [bacterium]|nr:alpha/beta hydrolase [bacterium]
MRLTATALALSAAFLFVSTVAAQPSPAGEPVDILTGDSLTLHAEYIASPSSEPAPLVVLLPMKGHTIESYRPFMSAVREYFSVDTNDTDLPPAHLLAVDLRGHGQSRVRGSDTVDVRSMSRSEYSRMPGDISQLIDDVLRERGHEIDSNKIFVVGASIGANTAILLTALRPSIYKVVALSPGSDYHGLRPADAFKNYGGDVMLVSSRGDTYSFETCHALGTSKTYGWLFKGYPGSSHGTDLFADKRVVDEVLHWMFAKPIPAPSDSTDLTEDYSPDSLSVSDSSSGR